MDYKKLNKATGKDHFPLPIIDKMLDKLVRQKDYSFLNGYSRYNQIAILPEDQENTTITCSYGTFVFTRTFLRCIMSIFSHMIEDNMKVFMNDFTIFGSTFN